MNEPDKEAVVPLCAEHADVKVGADAGCARCRDVVIAIAEAEAEVAAEERLLGQKMTPRQFRESGLRGKLIIPRSGRKKKVQRHPGESVVAMMNRIARGG